MNFREIMKATEHIIDVEKTTPAVADGVPVSCGGMETCEGCELKGIKRESPMAGACDTAFVEWLLEQWEKEDDAHVLFECNRKRCETCTPGCVYTTDVEFAKNFFVTGSGTYMEEGAIQIPDAKTEFPAFIQKEFRVPKEGDDD